MHPTEFSGLAHPDDEPPAKSLDRVAQRLLAALIVAGHLLAAWGLLRIESVRLVAREVAPLMIDLMAPADLPRPAPPPAAPNPEPRPALPALPALRPPPPAVVAAPRMPQPLPAQTPTVPELPPPPDIVPQAVDERPTHPVAAPPVESPAPVRDVAPQAAPAPPAPVAPLAPPAPPAPKTLPASAIRYLEPPPLVYPPTSRRLQESGTAVVRVVVDVRGLPRQVSLHRSSGFARLDEQALAAMRQARFAPQTDNGTPIEWIVNAPLAFELEN